MADRLQQGLAWLEQQRTAHCASIVLYRRGETEVAVLAGRGKTDYQVADESGFAIGAHSLDFLILVGDLGLEPRAGDRIVADGRVYEVVNLGAEGCFRYSDAWRLTYRIHVKDVGVA